MAERLGTQLQSGGLEQSINSGLIGSGLFGGASLDLNFAATKNVGPLVTFTRASSATYVGSDGLIKTATTNLCLQSQDFSTTWTNFNSTESVNTATAPDGTLTADTLIPSNGATSGLIRQDFSGSTFTDNVSISFSIFVKAAGLTSFNIQFFNKANTFYGTQVINASTGALSGSGTLTTTTVTPVGDGWFRVSATGMNTGSGATSPNVRFVVTSTGDGTSGIYLWGAQLEQSSTVSEYIPTTSTINSAPRFDHAITASRTNLLLRSEEFDTPSWVLVFGTLSANTEVSPNGTSTADRLIAANGGPTGQIFQSVTISSGATVTGSVYAKVGGFDRIELFLLSNNNTTPYGRSVFSLTDGTITTSAFTQNGGTNASSSVQALGNGWYRFIVTVTYPAVTAAGMRINVFNSDGTNGDGIKGGLLWGAQLETGSTATEYIPTTTAPVTVNTTESLGLLVEEQRTNLLLRSEEINNIAWLASQVPTPSANTTTAPDNTVTAETISVVASGNNREVGQAFTSTAGTTYSFSFFVKAGTTSWCYLSFSDRVAHSNGWYFNVTDGVVGGTTGLGVGTNVTRVSSAISPAANGFWRCQVTLTVANATTYYATVGVVAANNNAGAAAGNTIFVWGAQLEAGAFPTSYIPTTTAAVTRSADVASITGTNFSSWYRQDEGTVFAEVVSAPNNTIAQLAADISDTAGNERMFIRRTGGGSLGIAVIDGGVTQADVGAGSVISGGARYATAASYRLNSINLATNGQIGTEDTTATIPTPDRMFIGQNFASTQQAGGTIRRLTFWPQRLPNSTLQAITQ